MHICVLCDLQLNVCLQLLNCSEHDVIQHWGVRRYSGVVATATCLEITGHTYA